MLNSVRNFRRYWEFGLTLIGFLIYILEFLREEEVRYAVEEWSGELTIERCDHCGNNADLPLVEDIAEALCGKR